MTSRDFHTFFTVKRGIDIYIFEKRVLVNIREQKNNGTVL